MQCPTCKVEIKQPGAIQCPECNAFLPELPEQEKTADQASGLTETPDAFDSLLEEIATEVGRILMSDEQDSGKTESETENDAKPVAADPQELIELTDEIETEIDEFDKHIEATGDIESGADATETVETAIEVPDEIIELTDPVEPEDVIQEDDEDIEIISEEDFEPTKAPEMEVEEETIIEALKKPTRSSKVLPALVGAAVLIVAVALGGRVFLQKQLKPTPSQTKPPKIVAPTKNATPKQTVKKEVKKVTAEEKRLTVQKTHIEKKGNEQPKLDTRKETAVERKALAATEESKPLSIEGAKETVGQQALQTESQKDQKQKTDSEKAAPLVVAQKKLSPPEDEKETATTTIAATMPASGDTAPTDVAKIAPYYTIQVGSFKNKAIADAELAGLKPKVYLAYIIPKKYEKGFIRYKLRIGKYRTKEEAKKAAESYFDQEQTPYIIVRSEVEISP